MGEVQGFEVGVGEVPATVRAAGDRTNTGELKGNHLFNQEAPYS